METLRAAILIAGSIFILYGYLRLITDKKGNVDLNRYRLTGGIGLVISGMLEGTGDLFSRKLSPNGLSALAIYVGILLFYIGFKW
jgi:hypothetical protein